MMMPANYSAISENEMTYVSGGSVALEDILAPKLTVENWQKFNQNMVTIIGNNFVGEYVSNTIGTLFGGAYKPGALGQKWVNTLNGYYTSGKGAIKSDSAFLQGANGVLNAGLRLVGSAAAIYNLATGTVGNSVEGKKAFTDLFTVAPTTPEA